MSKQSYKEKLRSPKWQKKRLEIMQRDEFTCQCCRDTETTLNVHHLKYTKKNIWEEPNENLVTVCEHCHFELEIAKLSNIEYSIIKITKTISGNYRTMIIFNKRGILINQYNGDKLEKNSIILKNNELKTISLIINELNIGGKNG